MKSRPEDQEDAQRQLRPYDLPHRNGIDHDETQENEQEKELEDDGVKKGHEQVRQVREAIEDNVEHPASRPQLHGRGARKEILGEP